MTMHLKSCVLIGVAGAFALAGVARATDLNYDYIEAGYQVVDFDDVSQDLKSVTINGSFLVAEQVYVFAGYQDGETDSVSLGPDRGRIGLTGYTLGLGYRHGLSQQTDLNLAAAFERREVEGQGGLSFLGSDDESGYSLSLGLRHLLSSQFELGADVTYIDVGDDDTVLTLGGLWHINEVVAVSASYFVGSDADGFEGGIRFKF
jgi:hypothetical protein